MRSERIGSLADSDNAAARLRSHSKKMAFWANHPPALPACRNILPHLLPTSDFLNTIRSHSIPRKIKVEFGSKCNGICIRCLVFEHQSESYHALQESTNQTDSAPFITFMLKIILDAVTTALPQVSQLLAVLRGEMNQEALQSALELQDRKSFRERYLKPDPHVKPTKAKKRRRTIVLLHICYIKRQKGRSYDRPF